MKRFKEGIMRVLWIVVAVIVLAGASGPPAAKPPGVLTPLRAGQRVSLKETSGGYQVTVMSGVELGHRVVEVGPDYLALEDVTGTSEMRVPVYSIRAVRTIRLPLK